MGFNYQIDNIDSIYLEFVALETEIDMVGRGIKALSRHSDTANANYENAKNQSLLLMYAEESGDPEKDIKPFKRTEAHREALYRTEHANLRLLRGIAKSDIDSERDLLKALLARKDCLQSRKGLIVIDYDRKTGQGA